MLTSKLVFASLDSDWGGYFLPDYFGRFLCNGKDIVESEKAISN